jgi:LPXTG-site transpeptidase (sortase) family protein
VALAVVLAACSSGDDTTADRAADGVASNSTSSTAPAGSSPLADAVRPLPPAPITPEVTVAGPEPTGVTIGALDVDAAPVRPVGVVPTGEMEIPPLTEVGWYRFGSRPGEPGTAVLAAHVAYDGVDGVFRHLDDLVAGDEVSVTLSDGSRQRYVVTDVAQYPKRQLPTDVWARDGDPRLVLITCGGEFDDDADSYEDNVVAFARPA